MKKYKFKKKKICDYQLSQRFLHHLCRYGYLTGNHNQPQWMTRIEAGHFINTRETLTN